MIEENPLESARAIVRIRPLERSDIPRTTEWINRPEISEIMGYLPVLTLENQLRWFNAVKEDKSRFIFAICDVQSGEHIGNVGLGLIDYVNRHGMLNIFIAEPAMRGKGRGTAAVRQLLDFAFSRLNLNKVYLQTSERFVEAVKVYEKLGFNKDGVLREHYYLRGRYEDKWFYSMLRSEYFKK